jgi:hypothetical protein
MEHRVMLHGLTFLWGLRAQIPSSLSDIIMRRQVNVNAYTSVLRAAFNYAPRFLNSSTR